MKIPMDDASVVLGGVLNHLVFACCYSVRSFETGYEIGH